MIRALMQWPARFFNRLSEWRRHVPALPAPAPDETEPGETGTDNATGSGTDGGSELPPFVGPLERIPKGRAEMIEVYGNPDITYTRSGKIKANHHGRLSTVSAADIPGYGRSIYMHRLVQPYFLEAMRRSVIACPDYVFESIGCYNPRHQRHDPRRPLSDHTWGIAFDINHKHNQAFYRKRGAPLPFAPGWEKHSDLPRGVVEAWESVGFDWGGRWGNGERGGFCDPMHFSLRKMR